MNIKYQLIRHLGNEGKLETHYVPTAEQIADTLTKSLSGNQHHYLLNNIRRISCSGVMWESSSISLAENLHPPDRDTLINYRIIVLPNRVTRPYSSSIFKYRI